MSLRQSMQRLQAQAQHVTVQRDSLLRLMMQILIEHGGDAGELVISHEEANKIDLKCYVIDTVPAHDGRMAIRYRNTALYPTIESVPAKPPLMLVPDPEPEAQLSQDQEPPEETTPPCSCTHEKTEHIAGIGNCRRGDCFCEGYDPVAVTVA